MPEEVEGNYSECEPRATCMVDTNWYKKHSFRVTEHNSRDVHVEVPIELLVGIHHLNDHHQEFLFRFNDHVVYAIRRGIQQVPFVYRKDDSSICKLVRDERIYSRHLGELYFRCPKNLYYQISHLSRKWHIPIDDVITVALVHHFDAGPAVPHWRQSIAPILATFYSSIHATEPDYDNR